jgi:hypothetical protein
MYLNVAGSVQRGYYDLAKYALVSPLYWGLMSIAAWKGFLQLFYKPFYWEKTIHGHYLFREDVAQTMAAGEVAVAPRPVPELGSGRALPTLANPVPQPKWTPPDG